MKYYSEILGKLFNSESELVEKETAWKEKEAAARIKKEKEESERKKKNEEKEARWNEIVESSEHTRKLLAAYCKDYRKDDNWILNFLDGISM